MAFDRGSFIERLPADGYPTTGGTPATITVNLDHDQLLDRLAPATASTGPRLSGGQARRLACERGVPTPRPPHLGPQSPMATVTAGAV